MAARINLADPAYEPTDEDLARLMREAFAGLADAREESLRAMRARIAVLQKAAIAQFEARRRARLMDEASATGSLAKVAVDTVE